ncbi:hypothetical protein DKK66_16280 [Aquitalea sp. USM4]|nr:hypothetical protein DKK66_16280 [Aquitalea sp. USM4]
MLITFALAGAACGIATSKQYRQHMPAKGRPDKAVTGIMERIDFGRCPYPVAMPRHKHTNPARPPMLPVADSQTGNGPGLAVSGT